MTKEELEKFYAGETAQIMDCGHVVCDIFYVGTSRLGYPVIGQVFDVTGVDVYGDIEPEVLLKTTRLKPRPKVKKTGWIAVAPCKPGYVVEGNFMRGCTDVYSSAEAAQANIHWGGDWHAIQITWEEDAK